MMPASTSALFSEFVPQFSHQPRSWSGSISVGVIAAIVHADGRTDTVGDRRRDEVGVIVVALKLDEFFQLLLGKDRTRVFSVARCPRSLRAQGRATEALVEL